MLWNGLMVLHAVCVDWHIALRHFALFEHTDLLHPVSERISAETEQLRCPGLVVAGHRKGLPQQMLLEPVERDTVRRDTDMIFPWTFYRSGPVSQFRREVLWEYHVLAFENYGTFDHIFELSHVARPVILHQQLLGLWRHSFDVSFELIVELGYEMGD